MQRFKTRILTGLLAVALMLGYAGNAAAQVTLPDTGVDVAGSVTAAITLLGVVVAVVVGGFFAFRVVQWGLSWAGSRTKG